MIYDKLNGQTLAYVGDAYWSLLVRKYLIDKGITKAIDLQKNSIKFVSAKAQANFYEIIKEELNEIEKDIFKRGRNYKTNSSPKNTDIMTYHISVYILVINKIRLEDPPIIPTDNSTNTNLLNKSFFINFERY